MNNHKKKEKNMSEDYTYDELKPHLEAHQRQEIEDLGASAARWTKVKWGAAGFIVLTLLVIGLI